MTYPRIGPPYAQWVASLPEDERPTAPHPYDPSLRTQTWAESARTQKRLDPEGYAEWKARERHFIETGSDEPWPTWRVYRSRTPASRSRRARPAPAVAATGHPVRPATPARRRRG